MQVTELRRATDRGEPSNAELLVHIEALRTEFKAFKHEDLAWHGEVERRMGAAEQGALLRQDWINNNAPEVRALHDFRIEMSTYGKLLRFATGGSIIAALAATVSLIISLSHLQ